MKEKFQLADRINAEKRLKFGHKALLNQAISFQLGKQKFHATDKWLADNWGESTQVIKKIIKELKSYGLIFCELKRYKHIEGGKNWYNKRYIKVNIDQLKNFLDGADTMVTESEMKDIILQVEEIDNGLKDKYPIKDNEHLSELYGDKFSDEGQEVAIEIGTELAQKANALDFDVLRVIELITKHGEFTKILLQKFPNIDKSIEDGKYTDTEIKHLQDFHQAILLDEKFRNEYRSIQPIQKKKALS